MLDFRAKFLLSSEKERGRVLQIGLKSGHEFTKKSSQDSNLRVEVVLGAVVVLSSSTL